MPCSTEMQRIIMKNTVVQAEYYCTCCHLLIDVLFGWDTIAHKPKSQRGIFGYVEALVYALEQQGRLFIHHHGVAWIAGLPRTQSDWDYVLASEELKDRFERYCASIFAAELPVFNSLQDVMCPLADCLGRLEALPIAKKYKHLLKSTAEPPQVGVCGTCNTGFTESEIVSTLIDEQWNALADDSKLMSSAKAVDDIRQRFGGIASDAATSQVQLSRLLLKDQVHAYTHTRSCIKCHTGTKCRYRFFRDLVPATGFNKEDEILYRRRIGNQWLNTYIPIWRRVFHFNMDARVLWSGHSLQASRYAIQYTVKRQSVLDNVAVVNMAFKKRVEREATLEASEYALGVGRLLSLAYATSGVMEVGGPLATAILLEGEAVTFSCTFQRLILLEGINMLNNMTIEAQVVSRNQELFTETSIIKYMEQPRCLEDWCWYDFCSWFRREGTMTTGNAHSCSFETDNKTELRAHVRKHSFQCLEYPHVPEIVGPRLPDASRLGGEDYAEQSELYYRVASLLYRPFRQPHTILDDTNSAKSSFDSWNPTARASTKRALERHQQYYIGLQMAQQYRERQRLAHEEASDDEELYLDEDVLERDDTQQQVEGRASNEFICIPDDWYGDEDDVTMDTTCPELYDDDDEQPPITQLLKHSIASCVLPPDETMQFRASPAPITRAQVANFQQRSGDELEENTSDFPPISDGLHTTSIRLEAYERAIRELSHTDLEPNSRQLSTFASIREVSTRFNLNYRQHVAFTLIAVPLLSKLAGVPVEAAHANLFNGDPMIVTGAGGTGKSQIIAAVRALASSWCRPSALKVDSCR